MKIKRNSIGYWNKVHEIARTFDSLMKELGGSCWAGHANYFEYNYIPETKFNTLTFHEKGFTYSDIMGIITLNDNNDKHGLSNTGVGVRESLCKMLKPNKSARIYSHHSECGFFLFVYNQTSPPEGSNHKIGCPNIHIYSNKYNEVNDYLKSKNILEDGEECKPLPDDTETRNVFYRLSCGQTEMQIPYETNAYQRKIAKFEINKALQNEKIEIIWENEPISGKPPFIPYKDNCDLCIESYQFKGTIPGRGAQGWLAITNKNPEKENDDSPQLYTFNSSKKEIKREEETFDIPREELFTWAKKQWDTIKEKNKLEHQEFYFSGKSIDDFEKLDEAWQKDAKDEWQMTDELGRYFLANGTCISNVPNRQADKRMYTSHLGLRFFSASRSLEEPYINSKIYNVNNDRTLPINWNKPFAKLFSKELEKKNYIYQKFIKNRAQQKVHLKQGFIYLQSLEDSLDWVDGGGHRIYKYGYTEHQDLYKYIRQRYGGNHPTKQIKIYKWWKITHDPKHIEQKIKKMFQDKGMQYKARNTTTSEFVYGEYDIIIQMMNSCMGNDVET